MVGQHDPLIGHEFEQAPGDSDGQGSRVLQSMGSQRGRHSRVTEEQHKQ